MSTPDPGFDELMADIVAWAQARQAAGDHSSADVVRRMLGDLADEWDRRAQHHMAVGGEVILRLSF